MSFEPDNIEHEVSLEDLLRAVILRLDILIKHNEHLTNEVITEEDLEDDHS